MKLQQQSLFLFVVNLCSCSFVGLVARNVFAFRYFPCYTVRDYIGMAGGVLETGTVKKVEVFRSEKPMNLSFADFVKPGDTVYIPPNIKYVFFGKGSMIQIISTTVAMLLTYDRLTQK